MPHVPAMPASTRFFARLNHFECECPSCGSLITTATDKRNTPARLQGVPRARASAKKSPKNKSVLRLTWNPYAQRLCCPFCHVVYIAGLMLYSPMAGYHRLLHPPPDARADRREMLEIRRMTGGWHAEEKHWDTHHANVHVTTACSCKTGVPDPHCAVHQEGAKVGGENEGATAESGPMSRGGV